MKTSSGFQSSKAMALVLVLGFLVVISALTIAFFTSVTAVSSSSRTYAAGVTTGMLADTAVQMVMGQIRDATTPHTKSSHPCWTSQPGMIRVFGSGSGGSFPNDVKASSKPYAYYKLYSSDSMVLTGEGATGSPDLISPFKPDDEFNKLGNQSVGFALPNGGAVNPNARAVYTDLNAPILVPDQFGPITVGNTKYQTEYPILDPMAQGYPVSTMPPAPLNASEKPIAVEGFWLNNKPIGAGTANKAPGFTGSFPLTTISFNPLDPQRPTGNPAAMPVKWLYVLRDGTIVAPTSVDPNGLLKFTPQIDPSTGVSKGPKIDNPIVGRIAFWTDDETCKININTASEPTFWDTPLVSSSPEASQQITGVANYQPNSNEFQRYPGHPFSVALSPVLGRLFGVKPSAVSTAPYTLSPVNKTEIYKMIPRVSFGGSNSGTSPITGVNGAGSVPVTLDSDRLYSSVDELVFSASNGMTLTNPRPVPTTAVPNTALQRAKFFLTAYNRAPELNLFGQPRVCIWPIAQSTAPPASVPLTTRTIKDKEFAFCSTVGNTTSTSSTTGQYPYYFVRNTTSTPNGSVDQDTDWGFTRNQDLYSYLQYVTGGSTTELTQCVVPGFGGRTFLTKWANGDRDQVLTEIFDYIRCTNLSDSSTLNTPGATPVTVYTPAYGNGTDNAGQVVPIHAATPPATADTRGFGRFPTLSEVALIFAQQDNTHMQAILALETFCPSYGYAVLKDSYVVTIEHADNLQVTIPAASGGTQTVPLFTPSGLTLTNVVNCDPLHGWIGRPMGGFLGFAHTFWYTANASRKTLTPNGGTTNSGTGTPSPSVYPFVSLPLLTPSNTPGSASSGSFPLIVNGPLTIKFFPNGAAPSKSNPAKPAPVQTLTVSFPVTQPGGTGPVMIPWPSQPSPANPFQNRITNTGVAGSYAGGTVGGAADPWILPQDSVRSVEAAIDLRLIAAQANVPASAFQPTAPADTAHWGPTVHLVHSLRTSNGARHRGAVAAGTLATTAVGAGNLRFDPVNPPDPQIGPVNGDPRTADIPYNGGTGVKTQGLSGPIPGDWDSGIAKYTDGPFINKPDEGNINTNGGASSYPYFSGAGFSDTLYAYFSPNRIIASPGWFGSLPTGVKRGIGYQTLLFRPDGPGRTNHPGISTISRITNVGNPPDHLIMDLFDMPVVEPYPISEPFSTAGKINLNYQIMPFGSYIRRETAMRALLRSEKLCYIANDRTLSPDGGRSESPDATSINYRCDIDEAVTCSFLERRWQAGTGSGPAASQFPFIEDQVFRSPTQICELDLYPKPNGSILTSQIGGFTASDDNQTYSASSASVTNIDSAWNTFWTKYNLTGDNVRERPYARLYSRLTTKSNTFTVHLRVQTLQKRPADPNQDQWDENKDSVTGEYRGSALIERYLDPADSRFLPSDPNSINPDRFWKSNGSGMSENDVLEKAYKFRVLATKQFGQ